MDYQKRYVQSLFAFIILMLLPFIIISITGNGGLLLPVMAINFIIGAILLLYNGFHITLELNKLGIIMAFVYYILVSLTVVSNIFFGLETDYFDILNTLAKFITFILFFTIPLSINLNKKDMVYFLKLIITFSLISCIYNVLINYSDIKHLGMLTNSYDAAFQSFFSNRNQYGAFLFISITVLDLLRTEFNNTLYFYCIYGVIVTNLLLTMSRGAILATVVYMAIYFILKFKKKKDWYRLTAINLFLLTLINIPYVTNIISKYIIRPENGSTGRSRLWGLGYSIFKENNVFTGVGLQTSINIAKTLGMERDEFHNFYLEVLLGGGILELLFLLLIFIFILILSTKRISNRMVSANIIARLLGFLSLGLVESIGLFSMGYVDVFFSIFIVTIPILYANLEMKTMLEELK